MRNIGLHLGLGFVAVAGLAAIWIIARQVSGSSAIARFDRSFGMALYAKTTPEGIRFFRVITLLGTGSAIGVASAIVGLYLLMRRRWVLAIGWGVAQVGAVVLVKTIKALVERARPGLGDPTFFASGSSFPSGHVARTFVFCGMGAYLVLRITGSRKATAIACLLGGLASIAMAFSRMYLGAHFPSDVAAGLITGMAWLAVCISVTEEGLRRGR